jgi:peptidoglycan/LPS O-acetylase OafA/YrhL
MRIAKLDGLRGVLCLMVVFHHYPGEFIPGFIHNSFLVAKANLYDFFFVLSGFVIAYNYNTLINTWAEWVLFIQKRLIRLYPLLLYTTLVFFFITLGVKVFFPQYANNKDSFLPAIVDTISTVSLLNSTPINSTSFGINGNPLGMNYPSWSISAEMFAYLFFGIVALWTVGQKKNSILAVTIFIGMIILFLNAFTGVEENLNFVRGIVSFNIGYFVYIYSRKDIRIGNGWEIALLLLFFGLFYISSIAEGDVLINVIETCLIPIFFGLSIFTLLHTNGIASKLLERRPFQFLGRISYSIYLNHALLIYIFPKAMFSVFKLHQSVASEITVMVLIILLIIIYSQFTYAMVEVKGAQLLKRVWFRRNSAPVNVGAV